MDRISFSIFIVGLVLATTPAPAQAQSRAALDLLWQADTVVPPFYPGLALPAVGSSVKVTAIPDVRNARGSLLKTTDLHFEWVKDGKQIISHSGKGNNVLVYRADNKYSQITAAIFSSDGTMFAQKTITIPAVPPQIVLFEDEPLLGVNYRRPLPLTLELSKPEITLVAEPFFFNASDARNNLLNYDWRLQGKKIISKPEEQKVAILARPESGEAGENTVTVRVKNSNNIFQETFSELTIKFGQIFNGF